MIGTPAATARVGQWNPPEVWPQDDRVRVLQFLAVFALGGTERQVVNLVRGLNPSRYDLSFGCLSRSGELLGEVTDRGIPVTEYRVTNLYNARSWAQRLKFCQDLRRQHIHLVHAYNFYANAFAIPAARMAGVPVIASYRSTGGMTPLQERVQRAACRLADRISVNAAAVQKYLVASGYDPRKIVIIHNGVDLARFPARPPDGRLHQEFGIPPRAPLVAVLARLIPVKGIEYFLEAAAIVAARVPDARFLVVGDRHMPGEDGTLVCDTDYRFHLRRHALRLGLGDRITFTGFRLDVPDFLQEIAVSVLPSVGEEGLANAALEAMAAGVPVVATAVGGNAEVVEDRMTGLLVPPRDARALARAICHLLGNRQMALQFGAAGRDRVARYFSLERYVRETEHLYERVLAGRMQAHRARGTRADLAHPL